MSPTAEATVGQARDRELITRALRRLRRRVVVQRFFDHAAFDLAAALLLFLLVLAADRVAAPGLASFGLFGLFLLAAAAVSAARTFLFRFPSLFQAAVLADRRLELKERVASALYARELLGAGETGCRGETGRWGTGGVLAFHADLGWLLEREAAAALERAALAERFPFRLPRRAALAALALLLANGMLALWLPSYDLFGIARREAAKKELQLSVEEKKKELDRRLAELAEQAEEKRTPEAKKLLELLRAQAVEQEKKKEENAGAQSTPGEKEPGDPQKQAMVELGRREEEIKKGLQGEKFDKLKDSLKALEKLGLREAKLTRKLASALKEGNFEKAKQELDSLRDDFEKLSRKESSQLTPAEKERLEALARELERLAKESNSLDRLGRELAKAGASMSAKDFPQAFQGLDAAGNELESLASLASEMDLLDQALELVRMSKDDMARICPQCGTPYCPDCGKPQCACKPGQKPGGTWAGGKSGGTWQGAGQGRGRGLGKKGGAQAAAAKLAGATQSQSQSQGGTTGPQAGQASGKRDGGAPEGTTFKREKAATSKLDPSGEVVGSFVRDGPSPEGEARLELAPAAKQALQELSEEVEKEPLPVEHRRQVERFYDLLLEGKPPPDGE